HTMTHEITTMCRHQPISCIYNVTSPSENYTLSLHDALPILEVPSFLASLLKLPINALLITVSTTNRIGSFALSLIPSHALPTVSFNVSKALPTFSVAVSNNGFTVSRNQVATGLMTLFLMNAQASRSESRNRLNPVFTESITRDNIGQAVSRNHVTTGLITLFLTNAHAAFSESRIVLKACFTES